MTQSPYVVCSARCKRAGKMVPTLPGTGPALHPPVCGRTPFPGTRSRQAQEFILDFVVHTTCLPPWPHLSSSRAGLLWLPRPHARPLWERRGDTRTSPWEPVCREGGHRGHQAERWVWLLSASWRGASRPGSSPGAHLVGSSLYGLAGPRRPRTGRSVQVSAWAAES